MSGDGADEPDTLGNPRQSFGNRGRRALRVPIAEIPRARLLGESAEPEPNSGNGATRCAVLTPSGAQAMAARTIAAKAGR